MGFLVMSDEMRAMSIRATPADAGVLINDKPVGTARISAPRQTSNSRCENCYSIVTDLLTTFSFTK